MTRKSAVSSKHIKIQHNIRNQHIHIKTNKYLFFSDTLLTIQQATKQLLNCTNYLITSFKKYTKSYKNNII